jgi:hypothetical protein
VKSIEDLIIEEELCAKKYLNICMNLKYISSQLYPTILGEISLTHSKYFIDITRLKKLTGHKEVICKTNWALNKYFSLRSRLFISWCEKLYVLK